MLQWKVKFPALTARLLVDGAISLFLLVLLVFLAFKEPTEELPKDALTILLASYLGLLFACAYSLTDRLLILRALAFISEYVSYPRTKKMALVYSAVFFAIAAFYFVRVMNAG